MGFRECIYPCPCFERSCAPIDSTPDTRQLQLMKVISSGLAVHMEHFDLTSLLNHFFSSAFPRTTSSCDL